MEGGSTGWLNGTLKMRSGHQLYQPGQHCREQERIDEVPVRKSYEQ
jgi:hypothetical protein